MGDFDIFDIIERFTNKPREVDVEIEAVEVIDLVSPEEADRMNYQFQQEISKLDENDAQSQIEMSNIIAGE